MQTRYTARLSKNLARTLKKHSYRETAQMFGITNEHVTPSPGLVRLIVTGYEPRKPETRVRIGLPPEIKLPAPRKLRTIDQHLAEDTIQDMPTPLLTWALENRVEMTA